MKIIKDYHELKAKHARLKLVLRLIIISLLGLIITIVTIVIPSEHIKQQYYKTHATMAEKKANKQLAKTLAQTGWGWSGKQWVCMDKIFIAEARYDHKAKSDKSTAFGIGQNLSETSLNPTIQIVRTYRYVTTRYKNPCRAWYFHMRYNWY